jgi:hypothetical protein
MQSRRDQRIDVLRGVFIVSMTTGHLAAGQALDRLAHPLVWVDGAAGFVLFSGLVLGMAQRSRVLRSGPAAGRRWLLARARQLYVIHVVTTLGAFVVRAATGHPLVLPSATHLGGAWRTVWGVLLLRIQPSYFNVLPLYVFLLVVAVGMLELVRRGRWPVVLAGSAALYAASQVRPGVLLLADIHVGPETWVWGAWQVLFVGGFVLGWHWRYAVVPWLHARRKVLVRTAVASTALLAAVGHLLSIPALGAVPAATAVNGAFEKYGLRPGVVVYLAVALLASYWVLGRIGAWPVVRPITGFLGRIGTQSLDCFITLTLVQVVVFACWDGAHPPLFDGAVVALALAAMYAVSTWRGRPSGSSEHRAARGRDEVLRDLRRRSQVEVEVRGQERGGGEPGPALPEAAFELQRISGRIDRGVVELVATQLGAGGTDRRVGAQPGPPVAQ